MSVLISGVLINPAGIPVSAAEITFTALTTSDSVLNGFSASTVTNDDGEYSIPLEHSVYSITIQSDGYNSIYGSVSINEKSTPTTINELLKLSALEQTVTPAIIVYFREIQADVAAKLATMQTLNNNAVAAARDSVAARNEAAQYAQGLSAAVTQAQQAAQSATTSANVATTAKNAAEAAATNAQATLVDSMKKSANGSDVANPETFRTNIGLGSAATHETQASSTDAMLGRILKLAANGGGAFGLGNTVEQSVHSASGFFSFRMPATALAQIGLNMVGVGYQSAYLPNRRAQIFQSYADGQLRHRLSTTETAVDADTSWRVCWDDSNLKKQTGSTDTTPGSLLAVGAFGLGSAPPMSADANTAIDSGVTQFIRSPNAGLSNWPNNGLIAWRGINLAWDVNSASQIAMGYAPTVRMYVRTKAGTTYSGWSNVLLSNQYTVDANGFYKTASPVINIYTDGSFTTTDEADGVSVERISEGIYKITGCQGMHPDAAWNGIDGGIANPKCRNDKALLWNNYEVDEDGSITVYTFHRVHPDAMPFAQNRVTLDKEPFDPEKGHTPDMEWPDQSPIDVPRGLFIQVRVNMPERIEPKFSVMHSNVYCNSVSLV
ncbi:prophage tail fiber N-terminal domain-containing protein [Pectobacterium actinidiae]|uniref:phage tail fiber protein n=1 Tax=Pectobacterium actinidiae TaxID=1507808 RepID=UPI0023AA3B96|nr:prophage tail fiber N-terminal domain-containing protein [Pectobacterium actinidiae]WEF10300.1 prophage tail fiber N-terminal domain-containing protein [Pectobacterium actinidiae]